MILYASPPSSPIFSKRNASQQATPRRPSPYNCANQTTRTNSKIVPPFPGLFCNSHSSCICGRRRFIEAAATSLLPICPSMASSDSSYDYTVCIFFPSTFMGFSSKTQMINLISFVGYRLYWTGFILLSQTGTRISMRQFWLMAWNCMKRRLGANWGYCWLEFVKC